MRNNRIAELREAQSLTQRQLAEQAGISLRGLGYIERGEKSPQVNTAWKIAHVLGTDIASLFPTEDAA